VNIFYLVIPNVLYIVSKNNENYYNDKKKYYNLNFSRIIINATTSFFEIIVLIILELLERQHIYRCFSCLLFIIFFFNEIANIVVFCFCCALIHDYTNYTKTKSITLAYFSLSLIFSFINIIHDFILICGVMGIYMACTDIEDRQIIERNQIKFEHEEFIKELEKYSEISYYNETNDNDDNKICSICYENFKNNDKIIKLPCHHIYHYNCLMEWLKEKYSCPLDNNNLKEMIDECKNKKKETISQNESKENVEENVVIIYNTNTINTNYY
jgi:hypothetical protein